MVRSVYSEPTLTEVQPGKEETKTVNSEPTLTEVQPGKGKLVESTLKKPEELAHDELLIAYIRGEPVLGIFEPKKEVLITEEFRKPTYFMKKNTLGLNRIPKSSQSARYCFGTDTWIRAKTSISQSLAHTHKNTTAQKRTLEEMVPPEYMKYGKVFEKAASERFPEPRPWDHAINLKEDFVPKDCKVYPLTPIEQQKMDEWLDENLKKGYIRPSKSPMASPFFFVAKKDTDALRPCQDYQLLMEER